MGHTVVVNQWMGPLEAHTREVWRDQLLPATLHAGSLDIWDNQRFSFPWSCACYIAMLWSQWRWQSKGGQIVNLGWSEISTKWMFLLFKKETACKWSLGVFSVQRCFCTVHPDFPGAMSLCHNLSSQGFFGPSIRMQKMSQLSRVAKVPPLQHLEEGGTWLDVGENVNLLL